MNTGIKQQKIQWFILSQTPVIIFPLYFGMNLGIFIFLEFIGIGVIALYLKLVHPRLDYRMHFIVSLIAFVIGFIIDTVLSYMMMIVILKIFFDPTSSGVGLIGLFFLALIPCSSIILLTLYIGNKLYIKATESKRK